MLCTICYFVIEIFSLASLIVVRIQKCLFLRWENSLVLKCRQIAVIKWYPCRGRNLMFYSHASPMYFYLEDWYAPCKYMQFREEMVMYIKYMQALFRCIPYMYSNNVPWYACTVDVIFISIHVLTIYLKRIKYLFLIRMSIIFSITTWFCHDNSLCSLTLLW